MLGLQLFSSPVSHLKSKSVSVAVSDGRQNLSEPKVMFQIPHSVQLTV